MKIITLILALCLLPFALGLLAGLVQAGIFALWCFAEAVWKAVKP